MPLPEYYTGRSTKSAWILDCKFNGCTKRWHLSHAGAKKPGNLLALLDHARSHDAKGRAK